MPTAGGSGRRVGPIPVWYPLDENGERIEGGVITADVAALPVDPAIDTAPGRRSEPSPAQSPAASASRSSPRVTHFASAISPCAGRTGASAAATAWKPIMSERGNGQAWLE